MELDELLSEVRKWTIGRTDELGLERDQVEVSYVLNWGGFVNHSFRIGDGSTLFHLKLASDAEALRGLRQWRSLGSALEPYHAPPIVEWVSLPEVRCEGPLTAWIDGLSPERVTRNLAGQVLPVIARMHADREIATRIARARPELTVAPTCADAFLATFGDRFTEDLKSVELERPPFVRKATVAFMRDEIARFEDTVRRSSAFQTPVASPVHGDLWTNNLLVTAESDSDVGLWYLLDWDDLHVGDPVMDFAMFFGPTACDLAGPDCVDAVEPFLKAGAERERFALYRRASLFDWLIDSLADYLDADAAPEYATEVRAEKRRIHIEALELYTQPADR